MLGNSPRIMALCCLGRTPYKLAWDLQKQLLNQRKYDGSLADVLLLTEHDPCYTLGRGATLEYVKFSLEDPTIEWHRVDRGGEVTYHSPGQIVAYPILNLHHYQTDLHWYLRSLEAVVIHLLSAYGLVGERIEGLTGVWVEGYKVAAIGISASRWITMHGLALNVCPDLSGFDRIVPCGIGDRPVGSLAQFLPGIDRAEVEQQFLDSFAACFGVQWVAGAIEDVLLGGAYFST
jgi:lipoyl(octanoyl) transferase